MGLQALIVLLVTCSFVNGESPANQRWTKRQEMEALLDKLHPTDNPLHQLFSTGQFDLLGGGIPRPKPVSELNLTKACAEDVQFFRDSMTRYKEETATMGRCAAMSNSSECLKNHTEARSRVAWALEQIDSIGKLPSGILRYNLYWQGSYQQCLSIDAERPEGNFSTGRYRGKYCTAMLSLAALAGGAPTDCPRDRPADWTKYESNIHWALCIPSTCNQQDALELIDQYDKIKAMACNVFCIEEEEFTTGAIAMIAVFSVIGAIVLTATIFDYVQQDILDQGVKNSRQSSFATQVLLCFSVYTNGKKILDMSRRGGQLDCLHGLRVISMLWVILGHTYLLVLNIDNLVDAQNLVRRDWSIMVVNNATFSVDSFFTMSGFLVAYLWLKEEEKHGRKFIRSSKTWIAYYVHRYIRLTPVYMLIIGMNATLSSYFLRGPHQFDSVADNGRDCAKTWWTNLLYVNNLVYPLDQCYGPAWYLPNDMQFYWLAPAVLLLLLLSPKRGFVSSIILIVASMASTAAITVVYRFPAVGLAGAPADPFAKDGGNTMDDYKRLIYQAPWARFPTYLIGLLFGYAWQKGLCNMKISKLTAFLIWILAFASALAIVYGLVDYVHGNQLPVGVRALYEAVSRPAWSICVCWVIYACLSGRGGIINEFLAWRGWMPLSRLSYCMYLLHHTIIKVVAVSSEHPLHWDTHLHWVAKWFGIVVITTIASFFASCALEAPIFGLEKLLLSPALASPKKQQGVPEQPAKTDVNV